MTPKFPSGVTYISGTCAKFDRAWCKAPLPKNSSSRIANTQMQCWHLTHPAKFLLQLGVSYGNSQRLAPRETGTKLVSPYYQTATRTPTWHDALLYKTWSQVHCSLHVSLQLSRKCLKDCCSAKHSWPSLHLTYQVSQIIVDDICSSCPRQPKNYWQHDHWPLHSCL